MPSFSWRCIFCLFFYYYFGCGVFRLYSLGYGTKPADGLAAPPFADAVQACGSSCVPLAIAAVCASTVDALQRSLLVGDARGGVHWLDGSGESSAVLDAPDDAAPATHIAILSHAALLLVCRTDRIEVHDWLDAARPIVFRHTFAAAVSALSHIAGEQTVYIGLTNGSVRVLAIRQTADRNASPGIVFLNYYYYYIF